MDALPPNQHVQENVKTCLKKAVEKKEITIEISDILDKLIERACELQGTSKEHLIRKAIVMYIMSHPSILYDNKHGR